MASEDLQGPAELGMADRQEAPHRDPAIARLDGYALPCADAEFYGRRVEHLHCDGESCRCPCHAYRAAVAAARNEQPTPVYEYRAVSDNYAILSGDSSEATTPGKAVLPAFSFGRTHGSREPAAQDARAMRNGRVQRRRIAEWEDDADA